MDKMRDKTRKVIGKVAILGLGRMGSALVTALLSRGSVLPDEIIGTHHDAMRAKQASRLLGITVTTDNAAAAAGASVIILCVRPGQLPVLLREISGHVSVGHTVVSTAVGVPLSWMKAHLGECRNVYHVHPPSLLMAAAKGPSFIAHARGASASATRKVSRLFRSLGSVVCLSEKDIDACAVFSGCAPAFWAQLSLIWERLACESGISPSRARQIIKNMLCGMSAACERGPLDLHAFIDSIVTPGGVTEVGVNMLKDGTAKNLLGNVVQHCLYKITDIRRQFNKGT